MTPEQLLLVAQEFCAAYRTTVRDYAALAAAATASTATMDGVMVHANAEQAASALQNVLERVPALRTHNKEFAVFCANVYRQTCYTR
ncbi:toxin Fic [Corynebacterium phocae]|uniref:Toxin Fic n=1 Tax=Corynebacterium phocae TaxID=161895 RepID=A0A1L7D0I4_9CORY|nr:cell filamentation protein Fic [Corynebacterium phocae]APT91590.1 toxin Fic [Corynebacterium phocae]KAA8720657.1 cell filamentation protein Fic [Corynebacterium phocae]